MEFWWILGQMGAQAFLCLALICWIQVPKYGNNPSQQTSHTHTPVYIYTYIYIDRERERDLIPDQAESFEAPQVESIYVLRRPKNFKSLGSQRALDSTCTGGVLHGRVVRCHVMPCPIADAPGSARLMRLRLRPPNQDRLCRVHHPWSMEPMGSKQG